MNIAFHYYCVKTLCYLADIQEAEAQEIAFYSQFVDDFNLTYDTIYKGFYVKGKPPRFFVDNGLASRVYDDIWYFYPVTTGISMVQTSASLLVNTHQLRTIVPFHFIPPRPWSQIDDKDAAGHRCVQVSMGDETDSLMKTVMTEFLNSGGRDNMKLGMLLHIFADTYAHQNFSGRWGNENCAELVYGDLKRADTKEKVALDRPTRLAFRLPAIGHANLAHVPDAFGLEFSAKFKIRGQLYQRSNKDTFLKCAKEIWRLLRRYNRQAEMADTYFDLEIAPRLTWAGMRCLDITSEIMDTDRLTEIWTEAFGDFPGIQVQYAYRYDEEWEREKSGKTYDNNTVYIPSEAFYRYNQLGYEMIRRVMGDFRGEEPEAGLLEGGMEAMKYDGIMIRDDLREADTGISQRSAASVDIIPYGQNLLTWDAAAARYGEVLSEKNSSVISERNCNCYVRGKNLSQKTTGGTVQLFLTPYGVFCHPEYWYALSGYVSGQFTTNVPMISGQSGAVSEKIGAGEICLTESAFLINDDYNLKKGAHYCLCAVVSTPDKPVEIPQSFQNNIVLDTWVQDNPNVALLNVYPMAMSVSQMDQTIFFGNCDSVSCDFEFILQFYCDFDAGERWSSNSRVRIQCTDSNYPYDKSNLIIQSYQEGDEYQTIRVDMNNVPPNFAGMFMVYVDNVDPAPAHGVIDSSYAIKIKGSDVESLDAVSNKDRLLPRKTETGEVIYLLEIGSCFAYNERMSLKEFQRLRSRVDDAKARQRLMVMQTLAAKAES